MALLAWRFAHHVHSRRRMVALALGLALVAPLLSAALLGLASRLVDDVLVGGRIDLLAGMATAYAGLMVAKLVAGYAATRLEAALMEGLVRHLRVELFSRLVSNAPGAMGERGVGDRLAHLAGDIERTETLIFSAPLGLVVDLAAAAFFTAVLFHLNWKLALAALTVVPLMAAASWRQAPRVRRAARAARWRGSRWFDLAEECLGALPLIHAYSTQAREIDRFAAACDANRRAELATVAVQSWLTLLIELAAMASGLAVLALGTLEIRSGSLSVGQLVAFLGAVGSLYEPARGLARANGRFQRAAAGAQRVAALLEAPPTVLAPAQTRVPSTPSGTIEFRDVHFAYRPDEPILRGVTMTIAAGETVAIVGGSGSGKSTLIRLLLRFRDPQSGSIHVDGVDTRDFSLVDLRRRLGLVFQDALLLRGTIGDNIRYADPGASEAVVRASARDARAAEFIAGLGAGLNTAVGARGERLSGGQRQRIALARALLHDAPILILDEATAAVDSEAEQLIHRAITGLAGKRTIVLVAHRLSAIRHADRVVVLDRGRVADSGTPAELEARSGRYRELFAGQVTGESAVA